MKVKGENEVLKMKESELRRREEDERNHSEERMSWTFSTENNSHTQTSHLLINNIIYNTGAASVTGIGAMATKL